MSKMVLYIAADATVMKFEQPAHIYQPNTLLNLSTYYQDVFTSTDRDCEEVVEMLKDMEGLPNSGI